MFVAVGLGISFGYDASGALNSIQRELGLGEYGEPVLVIFVPNAKAVAGVRAAVADERIVAENELAFALREGRIIAAGNDAASEMVSLAGWIGRDLKLMRVRKKARPSQTAAAGTYEGGLPEGKLVELLNKPTLTYIEASLLLDHI